MEYKTNYSAACYNPPSFEDAVIEVTSGKLLKDVITFKCLPGYLLEGDPTVTCQPDGQWSKRIFTCKGKFTVPEQRS